jgi:hypothetical protein
MPALIDGKARNLAITSLAGGSNFGNRISKKLRSLQIVKMQIPARLQNPERIREKSFSHSRQGHNHPIKILDQRGYHRPDITRIQANIRCFLLSCRFSRA